MGRIGRRTPESPMQWGLRAVHGVRGAGSSREGICVRINDVYHASRIVLF
ncbi:hypothetical protein OKW46_004208 [Paraburkholderia sp. WSM4179]|nr:hypothetical protein [Paraburkholderia sp. WSM4179]